MCAGGIPLVTGSTDTAREAARPSNELTRSAATGAAVSDDVGAEEATGGVGGSA